MKLREIKTISERRKFIENILGKKFSALSVYPENLEIAQTKNCENMIGASSIPLGVAGPIKVNGNYASGEFYLPLATTEGALVASVNRGCKALTLAGGATSICDDVGITRGPVFETEGIKKSYEFREWINKNENALKELATKTSTHIKLIKTKIIVVGKNVFIRFSYDTMEAMGMNLATYATDNIVNYIRLKTSVPCISLAGNFDNDKKPSYLNFLEGRGRSVTAECLLTKTVLNTILKTTAEKIDKVVMAKINLGSQLAGTLSYNAHFANILAAIFIATGQDVAHVAEGSIGITSTEVINQDLYISVFLPDLPLGTVGGGTHLPAQSEALQILDIKEGKKGEQARKLAEIVGGAVLAGELSLLSALSIGTLAQAHHKFTNKKVYTEELMTK